MVLHFSNAFDKILHHHLSVKLSYYDIDASTQIWVIDFLHMFHLMVLRFLVMVFRVNVILGIPKGFILDPALFSLLLNNIKR